MEGDKQNKMTALVTGAGRGIGRQYAEQLAARGYDLILAGRSDTVVKSAAEIEAGHPEVSVRAVVIDLGRENAAEELFSDVSSHGESVDILVNNAGMFSFKDITDTSEDTIRKMIYLHDLTLTKLNRLFGADMAGRGSGHILNMSSFSIWMPFPGLALYSASKSYVKAFSVAFSKEMREKGVYVTAICPAGVATNLYGLSPKLQNLGLKLGVLITPELCARRGLRALFRHRRYSIPDWWNCLFIPILTHLPNWAESLLRKKTMQFQK